MLELTEDVLQFKLVWGDDVCKWNQLCSKHGYQICANNDSNNEGLARIKTTWSCMHMRNKLARAATAHGELV